MVGSGIYGAKGVEYYSIAPSDSTSLAQGAEAVSTIIVASMAQIAYPTIISEMKEPNQFTKALAIQQCFTLMLVNLVAAVFFATSGQTIKSPAFNSVPGTIGKIAYGLAAPSIIVCGVIAAIG